MKSQVSFIGLFNCRALAAFTAIWCVLFTLGCSSTQDDEQLAIDNAPPSRQDLYDGNTVVSVAAANPPKDEADALARAKREEKTGNLDQALYLYVQALDFNDQNAETLYNIARIHSIKGNIQLAYLTYNEALIIDPNMLMSHAGLGLINMDKRQHTQARIHLEKAVELDQKRLESDGNTKMSNQFFPLDKASPVRIYNAIAILEDMNNDHNMAREYYQLALQREPRSALITTNLGYSYYLTGNFTLAEKYLKRAIKEDPSFDRGWTNLGLVYVRKGLYARALTTFEHSMEPADALNDLGYFLMLEGQYSQAIELFQRAIDSSPSYFEQAQKNLKRASMELRSKNRH